MIKDIVVNLSIGEKPGPACDYAISVAAAFDAHLAGIAFLYDPIVPVSGAGYIPAEVIETQERDNETATRAALDRFTTASARAGVAAEPLTLSASFGGVGEQFGRIARRFDLSIVGQAEPETSAVEEIVAEIRFVRIRPSGHHRSLHPESAAQARPRHAVLGRQPGGGAGHRRRHAAPASGGTRRGCHRRQRARQAG